jgi:flavin reductase (DIM6/NTAB) family NADH-FMN oxidoreductase RutF
MSTKHLSINFEHITAYEQYKILAGSVVPRPIALITSISKEGEVNAAPFSFFNALAADPPLVGFGIQRKPDGEPKDTYRNIIESQEFTVNIVSDDWVELMNICGIPFEETVDEASMAGLSVQTGTLIKTPRIDKAMIALECVLFSEQSTGERGDLILGKVIMAHVGEHLVNTDNFHIDQVGLDAVGRMGGQGYARTRDYFDLKSLKESELGTIDQVRVWAGSK